MTLQNLQVKNSRNSRDKSESKARAKSNRLLNAGRRNKDKVIEPSLRVTPKSYPVSTQWARQDSNLRPTGYEPAALPLSYEPILPPMKSSTFHGNQICVERETGLEPATPCLEGRNSTTELLPRDRIYFTSNLRVRKQEEGFARSGQPQQRCLVSRYSKLDCPQGKGVSPKDIVTT